MFLILCSPILFIIKCFLIGIQKADESTDFPVPISEMFRTTMHITTAKRNHVFFGKALKQEAAGCDIVVVLSHYKNGLDKIQWRVIVPLWAGVG